MSRRIPVEFDGTIYASRNEAAARTGIRRRRIVAEGRAVITAPRQRDTPAHTARRIEAAAEKIRQIAATPQNGEDWRAVELRKRRLGLVKAIGYFRRRFGDGVTDYL